MKDHDISKEREGIDRSLTTRDPYRRTGDDGQERGSEAKDQKGDDRKNENIQDKRWTKELDGEAQYEDTTENRHKCEEEVNQARNKERSTSTEEQAQVQSGEIKHCGQTMQGREQRTREARPREQDWGQWRREERTPRKHEEDHRCQKDRGSGVRAVKREIELYNLKCYLRHCAHYCAKKYCNSRYMSATVIVFFWPELGTAKPQLVLHWRDQYTHLYHLCPHCQNQCHNNHNYRHNHCHSCPQLSQSPPQSSPQ